MTRLPASSDRAAATPTFKDGFGTRVRVTDAGGDPVEHLQLVPELAKQESAIRDRVGRLINFRHARYVRLRGVDRAKTGLKPLVIAYDALDGHRLSTVLEALGKIAAGRRGRRRPADHPRPAAGDRHPARLAQGHARRHRARAPGLHLAAAAGDRRSRARRRADAHEPPAQEAVGAVPHRLAGDQPRRLRREDGRRPDRPGRARPAARPPAHRRGVSGPGQAPDLQRQGDARRGSARGRSVPSCAAGSNAPPASTKRRRSARSRKRRTPSRPSSPSTATRRPRPR